MSETTSFLIKQVWRQKGDAQFDRIPFKEENKAQELSQTTRPVLLLETKANGGSNAVFGVGRVAEHTVLQEALTFPNTTGEYTYHVPFTYELVLADKSNGISREELQELAGQKFTPQAKGGLFEIEESVFEKVFALLNERGAVAASEAAAAAPKAKAKTEVQSAAKVEAAKAPSSAPAQANVSALADALAAAKAKLADASGLRALIEDGKVSFFPASLLGHTQDLVELQEVLTQYVASGGNADLELAANEAAAASVSSAPRYSNVIGLVERLVREGRYESVQLPTLQKAFYRGGNLPHPYLAIELQGKQGHHVLGADGTLYTVEGKKVQHYLGL